MILMHVMRCTDLSATVHGNRITAELNLLVLRICCVIILLEF